MEILIILTLAIIAAILLLTYIRFDYDKNDKSVRYVLDAIELREPDYKTLIISGSALINTTPQKAWSFLVDAKEWRQWQQPLIQSVRMNELELKFSGQKFEQLLNLGFPLGQKVSKEILGSIEPYRLMAWWKNENNIQSAHVWLIEQISPVQIKIYNTEVFYGGPVAAIKLLVARRWNKQFQNSVNQLKNLLETKGVNSNEKVGLLF